MKKLFITKENLKLLIGSLKKDCDEFIAPKREHLSDVVFGDTKYDGAELIDYEGISVISPRAFLLPQTETLFEIKSAKVCNFVPVEDKKKRVFYGVRPCDMKAIVLMKRFFLDDIVDLPYKEKLDNSLFIVLACGKRCVSKSFCHKIGSGPIAREGFDLQLIPLTGGYLVELGSKKGSLVIGKNKKLFAKPKAADELEAKGICGHFLEDDKKIDYKKLAKLMQEDKIKDAVWEDIGQRCVICSGCITLCPTCSCFSIADRLNNDKGELPPSPASLFDKKEGRGERIRYCDRCPYAGFTRMAGGTTPFPLHKDHIRRFFEHKLNVDVERYGTPSCVGCARCIQTCPGNISIYKFIEEVA